MDRVLSHWPRRIPDAIWLLLSLTLVGMVVVSGVNLPYMDEWPMTDVLANRVPLGSWCFDWHNEHLLPLPRFGFWFFFQIGQDLRLAMFVSVAIWSALSRVLMSAARTIRGGPSYSDAVFPLLLLHPGQYENVLMSYQIGFALSAFLAGVQLVAMLGGPATVRRVTFVVLCVTLLPLCGGHGLLFALAGFGYLGWVWASPVGRSVRQVAWLGLVSGLTVASFYAWLPGKPAPFPGTPEQTPMKFLSGIAGFGAAGWGPVGERLWPASGVVPVVLAITGFVILIRARAVRFDSGTIGAASAFGAALLMAAAISWGRSRWGITAVFFPRYVGLSAFLTIAVLFLAIRYGSARVASVVPATVATLALAALPYNVWSGFRSADTLAGIQRSALRNLSDGVPTEVVAEQFHFLIYNDPVAVTGFIERYAASGIGPVTAVRHQPSFAVVPLPSPVPDGPTRELGPMAWASAGSGAALTFDVGPPRNAYAVVVRGTYRYPVNWPPARATVAIRREPGGPEDVRTVFVFRHPTPHLGDPHLVIWVDGPVSGIRVVPDERPWGFRVTGAELRVPVEP